MRVWRSRRTATPLDEARRIAHRLTPEPWSIDGFVEAVSRHRGKPIDLGEDDLTQYGASGVWIDYGDYDAIITRRGASPAQREAIIGHELGHMLCDHAPLACAQGTPPATGVLQSPLAVRMLGRTSYDDHFEAEAEAFSSWLLSSTRRSAEDEVQDLIAGRLR